jgi:hypothetical protein
VSGRWDSQGEPGPIIHSHEEKLFLLVYTILTQLCTEKKPLFIDPPSTFLSEKYLKKNANTLLHYTYNRRLNLVDGIANGERQKDLSRVQELTLERNPH